MPAMMQFPSTVLVIMASIGLASPSRAQTSTGAASEQSINAAAAVNRSGQADADMAKVLAALDQLGPKPLETLTPAEARKQYSAADAVKKVIKDERLDIDPHKGLKISDSHFADMGKLRLRYYTPENTRKDSNLPVIVYFRGGGWVVADLDTYDATPSALARKANAIVISVDYPMAPEHKFPEAHEEAVEAYGYIVKHARRWGGNADRVGLVGEGAGGNLALATAIAARDQKITMPVAVVLVYPIATTSMDTPSKKEDAAAKPLNTSTMTWFFDKVVNNDSDKQDPRLNLVAANLKNLPPVTIVNAAIDPLRSDGDMISDKLKAAGNTTTHQVYSGVTHDFFGMDAVVAKAGLAQDFAVAQLVKGWGPVTGKVEAVVGAPLKK